MSLRTCGKCIYFDICREEAEFEEAVLCEMDAACEDFNEEIEQ